MLFVKDSVYRKTWLVCHFSILINKLRQCLCQKVDIKFIRLSVVCWSSVNERFSIFLLQDTKNRLVGNGSDKSDTEVRFNH